jgi:hypothetical protein
MKITLEAILLKYKTAVINSQHFSFVGEGIQILLNANHLFVMKFQVIMKCNGLVVEK